ncbi:MAG: hypothetical protein ACE5EE_11480 [Fidelibacterota bacterium]
MNKKAYFVTLVFYVLMVICPVWLSGQTEITLTLDKDTFLVDERIWFEAEEKNNSDEVVYSSIFRPSARSYCKVILKDSKGKEWPFRGGIAYIPYRPDWKGHEMKVGQNRYLTKDLLGIFGISDGNHRFVFWLPPGHYFLQVILHTNYHWVAEFKKLYREYGSNAYNMVDKRTVYSNSVEFDIVEPTGVEKEVQQQLLEAYRLTWDIKQGSTVQRQIFPILKEILDSYPKSVYAMAAHKSLRGGIASHVGYRMDLMVDMVRFKDRFYVNSLIGPLGEETARQIFPELRSKYPNTRLAKYIDYEYKYGRLRENK